MNILFSATTFYPFVGGAEISMYTLFRELSKENKIYVVCIGNENREFQFDGIQVYQKKYLRTRGRWFNLLFLSKCWEKFLSRIIRKHDLNVVLTQLSLAPPTVKVAKESGLPSILFIRDLSCICPISFLKRDVSSCNGFCWRCISLGSKFQYVFLKVIMEEHKRALKNADVVVANSKYVADVIKKKCGVSCEVIYPFINLDEYKVEKLKPKYVTFINPSVHKGGRIVLEIAKQMKDTEFLVVGRGRVNFGKLPNVTRISWVNDMRKVYSKTKILIVPSLWAEAFGRVVVEAMVNGIPCIVSGKGALPEIVGSAGIVIKDPLDVNAWIDSINKLKLDKSLYKILSRKSMKRVQLFDFRRQYKIFQVLLSKLLGEK